MSKFILLIVIFLFLSSYAFGCSLALNRISGFDMGHHIFIGEVVGIIETSNNPKTNEAKARAIGLKIKVLEFVFSPRKSLLYEVYPLRLQPDCSLTSDTKELSERFPVGSQVRVIAKQAEVLRNQPANSVIQLETSVYNDGSIIRNDLLENLRASAKSVYDYKSFAPREFKSKEEGEQSQSNAYLPMFELRKDLLRLDIAESEDEKAQILERLVYFPYLGRLDFLKLAQTNLKNKEKLAALEKQWIERLEELSKRNQRVTN